MTDKAKTRAQARKYQDVFEAAGAVPFEADILQSAETLLDLYGEDIRARAYVTSDPLRGEQMLRPDFTVPVVQGHMAEGATPARYTYSGQVFRRQEEDEDRASEYQQVGFEIFEAKDPHASDAEVFALFQTTLAPLGLRASTGDIGILMAAVDGLTTTDRRKAALKRHIWRPRRFRALLDRFAGRTAAPTHRKALITSGDPFADTGPEIGLRSRAEVEARIAILKDDATVAPIPENEVQILDELLSLREKSPMVLENLRDIAVDLPSIGPAVENMARRLDAMKALGVNVDDLDFETAYGRTTMEYYDGFVFGFVSDRRPDLPAIASGGRYDALTAVLGQGVGVPAVGGVIRPGVVVDLLEENQ